MRAENYLGIVTGFQLQRVLKLDSIIFGKKMQLTIRIASGLFSFSQSLFKEVVARLALSQIMSSQLKEIIVSQVPHFACGRNFISRCFVQIYKPPNNPKNVSMNLYAVHSRKAFPRNFPFQPYQVHNSAGPYIEANCSRLSSLLNMPAFHFKSPEASQY